MKHYIERTDIDIHEIIDFSDLEFEDINPKGRESVENTINQTTTINNRTNKKYVRKTIYINRDYLDVLEFFERKDSSTAICELIRAQLQREKGVDANVDLISIMEAIQELKEKIN